MTGAALAGMTALVTGAGRGIGRGCATLLAARGAQVRRPVELDPFGTPQTRVGDHVKGRFAFPGAKS